MNNSDTQANPWNTLSSNIVYKNDWISVREDKVIRPDGKPGIYGVVETKIATGKEKKEAPTKAESAVTPVSQTVTGAILSREQAISQLQEIAVFFRRSEPHSPVAYLADKAARWGSMSLHEWLRNVVRDDAALSHVEELLGVERRSPDSNDDA